MGTVTTDDATAGNLDILYEVTYVADWLRVKPKRLDDWRWKGLGPKFIKIGSLVRYRHRDVLAFLDAQTRTSTSDLGPPVKARGRRKKADDLRDAGIQR